MPHFTYFHYLRDTKPTRYGKREDSIRMHRVWLRLAQVGWPLPLVRSMEYDEGADHPPHIGCGTPFRTGLHLREGTARVP